MRIHICEVVFCTNRIKSNWVRFEFDSIESQIEFERIEFERFEFDSNSIRFDSNSRDITQISKKGNFCFRENWKVALHKVAQISKKGIFLLIIFEFDSIWLNSIRFGPNRISSIRIRFADYESESNSNQIRRIVCGILPAPYKSFGDV